MAKFWQLFLHFFFFSVLHVNCAVILNTINLCFWQKIFWSPLRISFSDTRPGGKMHLLLQKNPISLLFMQSHSDLSKKYSMFRKVYPLNRNGFPYFTDFEFWKLPTVFWFKGSPFQLQIKFNMQWLRTLKQKGAYNVAKCITESYLMLA